MKKTTMTLVAIRKYARQIMDEHGFQHVPFRWDAAPSRAGAVHYLPYGPGGDRYQISHLSLSRKVIPTFTDEAILETVLHEIAHLMTPGHGHDFVWQQAARSIGSNGERCYDPFSSRKYAAYNSSITG